MDDPHNLQRFVDAQEPVYEQVLRELHAGHKQGHWMWFIFPQLRGLGFSAMANTFGISSREEAEAYLTHPILGPRLLECTRLLGLVQGRSIHQILGSPDDLKVRSCLTLFAALRREDQDFNGVLQKYFCGEPDQLTLSRL